MTKHTYSKDKDIAIAFNTYSSAIGEKLANKCPQVSGTFRDSLNASNPMSIFLYAVTEDELIKIIKKH